MQLSRTLLRKENILLILERRCCRQLDIPMIMGVLGNGVLQSLIESFIQSVGLGMIGSSKPVIYPHAPHQLHIHGIVKLTSLVGSDYMGNTHDEE